MAAPSPCVLWHSAVFGAGTAGPPPTALHVLGVHEELHLTPCRALPGAGCGAWVCTKLVLIFPTSLQ